MMRIMLFNQSDNLYKNGLASFDSGYVVAPSPQMADIIRRNLSQYSKSLDVVTISKFLRDELSVLKGDEVSENYRGKSELLLLLSTLWKKITQEPGGDPGSYELFQRCFKLLTDLRSFSMSDDVLETALEHFDEKIAFGALRMHQVLNQLDIYDEHRSYFQLSEQLRSGELPITYKTERNLVFLGFDFLSASQVDLLRSYSIRDNVVVPVYENVYQNLADWDWLSWLDGEDVEKERIDGPRPLKKVPLSGFPKNYLSKAVKQVLAASPGKPTQVVLGERHLNFEKIQQVNLLPAQYKSPVDIMSDKIHWLVEQIPAGEGLSTEEALKIMDALLEERVEHQDFRGIRAVQLMKGVLGEWRELSDDNEIVTSFDLKILKEAVALDAPRVFQTSLGKRGFDVEIKGLKEIDDLKRNMNKVFCVASDFSSPKGNLVQYTEGVEKYLSSIGPLRRAELEFVALKEKMSDSLDENTVFLVEEGLLERDQGWRSFFDTLETQDLPLALEFGKSATYHKAETPYRDRPEPVYSATRLQTFLDCPRKYLFKYLLKLTPNYTFEDRLDALELGRLQHAVIEQYVNRLKHYTHKDHEELAGRLVEKALEGKTVSPALRAEHLLEVINNTRRAIKELLEIKARPGVSVKFEQKIDETGFQGSVDCVVETEKDIILLDFKRGPASLPTQTAFKNYEKIQLWFYANHWDAKNKRLGLGYICLSDMEKSLLFFSEDEVKESFKGAFEAKPVSLAKNFEELFLKYQEFEKTSIERLGKETAFEASPVKADTCMFCELNKLCPRSETAGVENAGS